MRSKRKCVKEAKERNVCAFLDICETVLLTINLHLSNQLCEELHMVESVKLWDEFVLENRNQFLKEGSGENLLDGQVERKKSLVQCAQMLWARRKKKKCKFQESNTL